MKNRLVFLTLIPLLNGCIEHRAKDILSEFKNRKYRREMVAGAHQIEIIYLPRTAQLLNGSGLTGDEIVTGSTLDSLEKSNGSTGFAFLMRLSPRDSAEFAKSEDLVTSKISGYASYSDAFHAYTFGLQEKIWIEAEGRKFPLKAYRMENTFGITKGRNFVLAFDTLPAGMNGRSVDMDLVLDDIVPGLARKKITWTLPVGAYDQSI